MSLGLGSLHSSPVAYCIAGMAGCFSGSMCWSRCRLHLQPGLGFVLGLHFALRRLAVNFVREINTLSSVRELCTTVFLIAYCCCLLSLPLLVVKTPLRAWRGMSAALLVSRAEFEGVYGGGVKCRVHTGVGRVATFIGITNFPVSNICAGDLIKARSYGEESLAANRRQSVLDLGLLLGIQVSDRVRVRDVTGECAVLRQRKQNLCPVGLRLGTSGLMATRDSTSVRVMALVA